MLLHALEPIRISLRDPGHDVIKPKLDQHPDGERWLLVRRLPLGRRQGREHLLQQLRVVWQCRPQQRLQLAGRDEAARARWTLKLAAQLK